MTQAAAEIEAAKTDEIIESKEIDGNVGDIVIEGDELLVIEEVSDEKDAKPIKDEGLSAEELAAKAKEPAESSSSGGEDVITEDMRVKLLEVKIGRLDKDLAEASLTPEQIRDRVPLVDMQADIKRQRSILSNIDKDLNPDEWDRQNGIVTTLDGDITIKERNARLDQQFNSQANKDFLENEKKLLADKGFEFSDPQFEGIAIAAEKYLDNGKFTKESIRKGLIDIVGAEATDKMYEVSSEQKIRKDIKGAVVKVTKTVRVTRSGVSVHLGSRTQQIMAIQDPDEKNRALDALTDAEYAIYKKDRERIKNKK